MEKSYAVINDNNEVINNIRWDGETIIDQEPNTRLIESQDKLVYVGGTYDESSPYLFIPSQPEGDYIYISSNNTWIKTLIYEYQQTDEYISDKVELENRLANGMSIEKAEEGLFINKPE